MAPDLPEQEARRRHPVLAFFASRPITVSVILVATTVVGAVALGLMPIELMPSGFERQTISVDVPYNKANATVSPMVVERDVTLFVEAELSTIPGLVELDARSRNSGASFSLNFEGNKNLDEAYAETTAAIERARLRLPADVGRIQVRRDRSASGGWPIAFLSFYWDDDVRDPHVILEQVVQPFIESIDGVSGVTFLGGHRKFIAVDLDPDKTRAHGINLNQLLQRLRGDNFRAPAGKVRVQEPLPDGQTAEREVYLVADSMFGSIEQIEMLPVAAGLTVADITRHGKTSDGRNHRGVYETLSVSSYVRVNGKWGATAMVFQSGDANTVTVCNRLKSSLDELRARPDMKGFQVSVPFNQGDLITDSIGNVLDTLLWGGLLAFIVLLVFLKSWRLSLVIALSIPLAMTMALAIMYFWGQSINLLVLMGFTLAAGMLLDNAIVVAENIYRRSMLGEGPAVSAIRGAGEIGLALVLATSTTVIVFISVIFFSGERFMQVAMSKIGMPVCLSLGFSILIALVVIPVTMLKSRMLGDTRPSRIRLHFVRWRENLGNALGRGGLGAVLALPLLGLWELAAVFIGRNAHGMPQTPVMNRLAIGYGWLIARVTPLRYLIAPLLLVGAFLAISFAGGALERTDQNQGNRDRIQLRIGFPRSSDVMVGKRALFVTQIAPGSPAEKAGLRVGDFVLLYNARAVAGMEELDRLAAAVPAGVTVPLEVARGSAMGTVEIAGGPTGIVGAMQDTQPLRDAIWNRYIFEVEDILLGKEGADLKREQAVNLLGQSPEQALQRHGRTPAEAREYFGIETLSSSFSSARAQLWIYIDRERVDNAGEFYKRIMASLPERAGVEIRGGFEGGSSASSEAAVRLTGPDTTRLLQLADEVALRLGGVKGLEGVRVDTDEGMDEVTLSVDRQRASAFGVQASAMGQALGFQLSGTQLRDYQQGEAQIPVRVRFAPPLDAQGNPRNPDLQDVTETRIPTGGTASVSAKSISGSTGLASAGLGEIRRRNRQTSLRVVGTTSTEDLQRIQAEVESALQGIQFPPGYGREMGGRFEGFGGAMQDLMMTGIWAGLLVFLVMCFLFESFLKPVGILIASVPGALAGGYLLLWVTNTPDDNLTRLGLMVLIGVVVNNGIVLVDLVNRLRAEGVLRHEAVTTAARQRLRPILLTTLTTVFGLIPMAVGDSNFVGMPYYPMGRMVLGGMVLSMVYTLLLVPCLYLILDDLGLAIKSWGSTLFAPRQKGGGPDAAPAPAAAE